MKVKPGANSLHHDINQSDDQITSDPLFSGISVIDHREVKGSYFFSNGKHYIITKMYNSKELENGIYCADCDITEVEKDSVRDNVNIDELIRSMSEA